MRWGERIDPWIIVWPNRCILEIIILIGVNIVNITTPHLPWEAGGVEMSIISVCEVSTPGGEEGEDHRGDMCLFTIDDAEYVSLLSVLQRFYWSPVKFKTRSRPSTHVTMLWLARMSCPPPPSPWYDCLPRQYDNAAVYWFVVSATINNNLQYPGSVSMLVWPQPKCIN